MQRIIEDIVVYLLARFNYKLFIKPFVRYSFPNLQHPFEKYESRTASYNHVTYTFQS